MPDVDKECVAQVLERAAEILDEKGWVRGHYQTVHGEVCAMGAINTAVYGHGSTFYGSMDQNTLSLNARRALERHLEGRAVENWNDSRAWGKWQVKRNFKKVARKLRKESRKGLG